MASLWESVQQGELKAKQQHEEAVGSVQALRDQINTQTDKESLGLWVSQLLEPKFSALEGEMEREAVSRTEVRIIKMFDNSMSLLTFRTSFYP